VAGLPGHRPVVASHGPARRTIVAWRHGRTAWNVAGRVQGQTDIPLDEVGRGQAASAAARLARLKPDRIVTSDLSRARETAETLGSLAAVPVTLDRRLRELAFGEREGLTWAESWERFPDGMQAWFDGDETQIPGSETHRQTASRFVAAVHDALEDLPDDGVLVVVAHGAVLRSGVAHFLGIPEQFWWNFGGLGNCSWSVLEEVGPPEHRIWRLAEWNAGTLPEPVLSDDE
jgi:probable phosphoglycerate mutase